jgi:hypothetical protein
VAPVGVLGETEMERDSAGIVRGSSEGNGDGKRPFDRTGEGAEEREQEEL